MATPTLNGLNLGLQSVQRDTPSPSSSDPTLLFSDCDLSSLNVPSNWRTTKDTKSLGSQTTALRFATAEAQTVSSSTIEVQTEDMDFGDLLSSVLGPIGEWRLDGDLAAFVSRVSPMLCSQLARNATSHAFDDFDAFAADENDQVERLHVLSTKWLQASEDDSGKSEADRMLELPCTGLSWSSTGSSLCVAFGRTDHHGWCTHRAGLGIWNVFAKDFDPARPAFALDTLSCLMSVACHPEKPSIVAAGTFNGEVVVWDTNRDEPLVAQSRIDDYFHREPVAKLEWMQDMMSREYLLVSISGDGKVLLWSLANNLEYPVQGFRLTPRRARGGESSSKQQVAGATALSLSKDGRFTSSFIVGSEGGGVFKCLVRNMGPSGAVPESTLKWSSMAAAAVQRAPVTMRSDLVRRSELVAKERFARETMPERREVTLGDVYGAKPDQSAVFPNPIDFAFHRHSGAVLEADCSPYHRNVFLSCGVDGRINIFSTLQSTPLAWYEPSSGCIASVQWSKVRPMVFAAAGADGCIYVFDLQASVSNPMLSLWSSSNKAVSAADAGQDTTTDATAAPMTGLAFNPRQRALLAAGDEKGRVFIWKLGWRYSNPLPSEEQLLARLVDSWEDDGATGNAED